MDDGRWTTRGLSYLTVCRGDACVAPTSNFFCASFAKQAEHVPYYHISSGGIGRAPRKNTMRGATPAHTLACVTQICLDPRPMSDTRLRVFLNDHLSGLTGAVELAKRTRSNNDDEDALYDVLDALVDDFEDDRDLVEELLDEIDEPQDGFKKTLAVLGERFGRLKPNDGGTGYSPLSRVVELEGLLFMLEGSRVLWSSLDIIAEDDDRLDDYDFAARRQRAERRHETLDRFRRRAVEIAFIDEDEDFEDLDGTSESVRVVEDTDGNVDMIVIDKS